jgi:hypothetical protein
MTTISRDGSYFEGKEETNLKDIARMVRREKSAEVNEGSLSPSGRAPPWRGPLFTLLGLAWTPRVNLQDS